ncbi:MAG: GNAT family N-acetyltransferase [Amphritea sp.]
MVEAIAAYEVIEAGRKDFDDVARQVIKLLLELEPEASQEIEAMDLPEITRQLLGDGKIYAFLAKTNNQAIGVLTLHECAALYAGGVFGEISELYVDPVHRSQNVGKLLIEAALVKARQQGWMRLEVGAPPVDGWCRTLEFYESNEFKATGTRLRRLMM